MSIKNEFILHICFSSKRLTIPIGEDRNKVAELRSLLSKKGIVGVKQYRINTDNIDYFYFDVKEELSSIDYKNLYSDQMT